MTYINTLPATSGQFDCWKGFCVISRIFVPRTKKVLAGTVLTLLYFAIVHSLRVLTFRSRKRVCMHFAYFFARNTHFIHEFGQRTPVYFIFLTLYNLRLYDIRSTCRSMAADWMCARLYFDRQIAPPPVVWFVRNGITHPKIFSNHWLGCVSNAYSFIIYSNVSLDRPWIHPKWVL